MASLLDRVMGGTDDPISSHDIMAALAEYERGFLTKAQIATAFELTSEQQDQLQEFLDNIDSSTITRQLVHDVLMLGEAGFYTKANVKNRLGLTYD
jgi:subtilase family serine protease